MGDAASGAASALDDDRQDTIAAIATAQGRGGVGILRIAGPRAFEVAERITRHVPVHRTPRVCRFFDANGELLDRGLMLPFAGPASFTGDDVVELHGHGSPIVLDLLLAAALESGTRLARPGEFSLRAFLAGKIDLAQAEAIADLIDSTSQGAARAAARSLEGEFSRQVSGIGEQLLNIRVQVEAAIDFPDEDIELLEDLAVRGRLQELLAALDVLCATAQQGALLRDGIQIAISGAPNAGKSSLLNRLSGRDSAIVTEHPGTTRDVVREQLDLDGLRAEVLDTAGLRAAQDPIEQEGIRRAHRAIAEADVTLLLVDGTETTSREVSAVLARLGLHDVIDPARCLLVVNKIDLTGELPGADVVPTSESDATAGPFMRVSAVTGQGLVELRGEIRRRAGVTDGEPAFLARQRHCVALAQARDHIRAALSAFAGRGAIELAAEDLVQAQRALGSILGDVSADALLGAIFSSFCIGK